MKRILSLNGVVLVVGGGPPPDGPDEFYHDNGQLEFKGTYKDGKPCGECTQEGKTVTYPPC